MNTNHREKVMGVKIGINGFGRIGRMVFRAAMKRTDVQVTAVNDLMDVPTMAYLLKYDSVHGRIDAEIVEESGGFRVDGKFVAVSAVKDPAQIPWREAGAEVIAECTGLFRDRASAARHIDAGAQKAIISAPAKDPDITIVMGVNHQQYDPRNHHILSNASCTTNCLAPVAKVILENFGVQRGLMTTVHAYTGDQRLLDFPHKDLRRARAAGLSMIPTSTGAARAVALVLPDLAGKLNGLAVRVPTPNVSLVDFTAVLEKKDVSTSEINKALQEAAETTLKGVLGYSEAPLVSVDFNGTSLSSIVDAPNTYAVGNLVKILAWYDNECGYSTRMVDLAAWIGKNL